MEYLTNRAYYKAMNSVIRFFVFSATTYCTSGELGWRNKKRQPGCVKEGVHSVWDDPDNKYS